MFDVFPTHKRENKSRARVDAGASSRSMAWLSSSRKHKMQKRDTTTYCMHSFSSHILCMETINCQTHKIEVTSKHLFSSPSTMQNCTSLFTEQWQNKSLHLKKRDLSKSCFMWDAIPYAFHCYLMIQTSSLSVVFSLLQWPTHCAAPFLYFPIVNLIHLVF